MKRMNIDASMVADIHVLAAAAAKAAAGKRRRPDVARFFTDFDRNIARIRADLLSGAAPYNRYRQFTIFDPKQRVITAVGFEDRIIHHALMAFAAPVLEKAMVDQSYACRPGKGPLQAVVQAQANLRKHPWYVKIDVASYFETVDHGILFGLLTRKFKGDFFFSMVQRILQGYETAPGKGLPIGSLTSQYFANFYLDGSDRLVLEQSPAKAYVRYMDDMVWWAGCKAEAKAILSVVKDHLQTQRLIKIRDNVQVQRSLSGLTYCGYRILPGSLRLTVRKKRRYAARRAYWERLYAAGRIDARQLQGAYDSVRGVITHASARAWMRRQLMLHPAAEV
jgi:retron-type reverse transcriptase